MVGPRNPKCSSLAVRFTLVVKLLSVYSTKIAFLYLPPILLSARVKYLAESLQSKKSSIWEILLFQVSECFMPFSANYGRSPFSPKFRENQLERTIPAGSDLNIWNHASWRWFTFTGPVGPKCSFLFDKIVVPSTAILYPAYMYKKTIIKRAVAWVDRVRWASGISEIFVKSKSPHIN